MIIGAGIAGLTTATVLARGGWQVEVLERAETLRVGGYKIDVRGAALDVLARMGLEEAARALHLGIRAGSVVAADGTTLAQLGGDTFGGRAGRDIEVERGDLLGILAETATQAGARITTGVEVTSIEPADGRPVVHVAGGDPLAADIVIGVDGTRSIVRDVVLPGQADVVRDLGYGIAVHDTEVDLGIDREEMTYVVPGRTALVYDTGTLRRAMYLFERSGTVPRGRAEGEAYLRDRYGGQGWRVPDLLAGLSGASDLYLDAMVQVVAPTWSRGRIVLVGDAAWCASPASGQGTSLALVGGYVLAARLAGGGSPESALAEYERAVRGFVAANQELGPGNVTRMVLGSDRAVRSTLTGLRVMHWLPFGEWLMRQAMRPLHRAANAIDVAAAAGT